MSVPSPVGRTEHRAALQAASELLAVEHPSLRFECKAPRGARAQGPIQLERPDGTVDDVEVEIIFPSEYPTAGPIVRDAANRWEPSLDRHILHDHTFCLYLREVDEPDLRSTVGREGWLLDLTLFLQQQLILDAIGGTFPGPEWAHGQAAYAQRILELLDDVPTERRANVWETARSGKPERNGLCPCSSGRKVKRCHGDALHEMQRIARRVGLKAIGHEQLQRLSHGQSAEATR